MEKEDVIRSPKKIRKKLREYQKKYREAKKHASQMQTCQ